MKIFFISAFLGFLLISNSYSKEIIDCSKFTKLSKKYLECKSKNLRSTLDVGQEKAKKKIKLKVSNLDSSEVKKKFNKSKLKKALLKIKNSKTGSDLFNKE